MNVVLKSIAVFFLLVSAVQAQPLTEQTYLDLQEASQINENVKTLLAKNEADIGKVIDSFMQGRTPNEKEQVAIDKIKARTHNLLLSKVSSPILIDELRPMYMDTFTEEEVRGIIDFYKTPAGLAIIHKMPLVGDAMGKLMYRKLTETRPEAELLFKEYTQELMAARVK